MKRKNGTGPGGCAALACLLPGALVCGLAYGASSLEESTQDYVVNVTISTGTCDVDVSPATPPAVMALAQDMAAGGVQGATSVDVLTANCLGLGAAAKTPSVKVKGSTYDQVELVTPGVFSAGPYLFYNPGSAVKWAGFVLSKSEAGTTRWGAKPADEYVKDGEVVPLGLAGDTCSDAAPCSKTFWVGLACGETADCLTHFGAGDNAGALNASISFTFLYN